MNIKRTLSLSILFSLSLVYEIPVAVMAWAVVLAGMLLARKTMEVVLGV